jgi:hypothetical protein
MHGDANNSRDVKTGENIWKSRYTYNRKDSTAGTQGGEQQKKDINRRAESSKRDYWNIRNGNSWDPNKSRDANNSREATISGKPKSARMPTTAGTPTTAGLQQ